MNLSKLIKDLTCPDLVNKNQIINLDIGLAYEVVLTNAPPQMNWTWPQNNIQYWGIFVLSVV